MDMVNSKGWMAAMKRRQTNVLETETVAGDGSNLSTTIPVSLLTPSGTEAMILPPPDDAEGSKGQVKHVIYRSGSGTITLRAQEADASTTSVQIVLDTAGEGGTFLWSGLGWECISGDANVAQTGE